MTKKKTPATQNGAKGKKPAVKKSGARQTSQHQKTTETSSKLTKRQTKPAFNGLTPQEWTQMSRNVWSDVSSPRGKRQLDHGAVFPLKLAERMVTLYSNKGDLIVDPFLGIGTTAVAAVRLGRNSIGTELNCDFAAEASKWLAEEQSLFTDTTHLVVNADCRTIQDFVKPDSIQLSFTSPPYADFIQRSTADRQKTHKTSRIVIENNSRVKQYSEHQQDFGNLDYDNFLKELSGLFKTLLRLTKIGGYSAWVVKDYRLPPDRPYVSMHSDIAQVAVAVGWLWHDLIIWDQNEQRRLVLLGYPTRFYTNQNCSFIVVFRRAK